MDGQKALYRENGVVIETMLLSAPNEFNANDPVGLGADEHFEYLNVTLSYYEKTNEDIALTDC
jgi:hypothetical protein